MASRNCPERAAVEERGNNGAVGVMDGNEAAVARS